MAYDICQVNNEINNKNISVFCQYDGGSTDNFILSSLANNLELSCQNVKLNLTRVGLPENIFHTKEYYLNLVDKFGKVYTINCYGVPSLSKQDKLPSSVYEKCAEIFNIGSCEINQNHGEVGILLGINSLGCFPSIVKVCEDLALAETKFGQKKYIIIGRIPQYTNTSHCNMEM